MATRPKRSRRHSRRGFGPRPCNRFRRSDSGQKRADRGHIKAASSSTGNYTLAQLPAGTYDLFVVMPSFATYRKPGVLIQAGQKLRLDIHLEDTGALNTLGDGRAFFNDIRGVHEVPSGPAPRTPDGRPDFSAVWHAMRDADPDAEIAVVRPLAMPW